MGLRPSTSVAIASGLLAVACSSAPSLVDRDSIPAFDGFSREHLLVLSDADMAGFAYADGKLRQVSGLRDALTVIEPNSGPRETRSVPASNSVVGWPGSMAASADGRFVYVIEVRGEVPDDVEKVQSAYTSLPEGLRLEVFQTAGRGTWASTATMAIGRNPKSVDVAPDGGWLVAPVEDEGGGLALVRLEDGLPAGAPTLASVDTTEFRRRASDLGPLYASIDPTGRYIALNLGNTHVGFFEVVFESNGRPAGVKPVGDAVEAGRWISMGEWSKDGQMFLVADTGWGPKNLDAVFNGPGAIACVRFDALGKHEVVSKASVSLSPESFAMDPSGELLAVVNMERTYLPFGLPYALFGRRTAHSLSLVQFDPVSGRLETVDGPLRAEGVLPENAVFDGRGEALAVVTYHERSEQPITSWVQFYRVERSEDGPRLVPTRHRVEVPRGGHDLLVIPRVSDSVGAR